MSRALRGREKTTEFTVLIQSEKLLSQLVLRSGPKILGMATRLGEEEVQILVLLLLG